jgi:hypothetical protein
MAGANSGEYSRFLSFHGRNPDVLNSIANLSNDEVFTPPEFANRMLDTLEKAWADSNGGENIWANPDLKFLDPFTKSGVFLREIATRLIKGLELEIPDLQTRVDHILTKQVFGIATTQLTSLMARRSLYCSKRANGKHSITKKFTNEAGNIWFQSMSHTWKKGTIRELTMDESGNEVERYVDGKCKYCGASKRDFEREEGLELHAYGLIHQDDPKKWVGEIFGLEMQFDVIIGNPPYQLEDGGFSASAAPIYDKFVESAMQLDPKALVMVIPSRWFAGGKGLDKFRAKMLSLDNVKNLVDYPDSTVVFPGVDVKGGVCFFLVANNHVGPAEVVTVLTGGEEIASSRYLRHKGLDVFVRYSQGLEILDKVAAVHNLSFGEGDHPELFQALISSSRPFGFRTNFKGGEKSEPGMVRLLQNGGIGYVNRSQITTGLHLLDSWKVFISAAYGAGNSFPHSIIGKPILGEPGTACTETYLAIGPFDDETQARQVMQYISTKFFRFLVMLRKPAQHATKSVYAFVPNQDFGQQLSDEVLAEKYDLSQAQRNFIDSLIRPMELENG